MSVLNTTLNSVTNASNPAVAIGEAGTKNNNVLQFYHLQMM